MLKTVLFLTAFSLSSANAGNNFNKLNSHQKSEYIWNNVVDSKYIGQLPKGITTKDFISLLKASYYKKTWNYNSDFLPQGRKKLIHPYGSVAKVEVKINKKLRPLWSGGKVLSNYLKGLFSPGTKNAIARMGQGFPEKLSFLSIKKMSSFAPGMALKFLRDGQPSLNLQATGPFDGLGNDYNFFNTSLSNVIKPPTVKSVLLAPVIAIVKKAKKMITPNQPDAFTLSLAHLCHNDKTACPFRVEFVPTKFARSIFQNTNSRDPRPLLNRIPKGTKIYDILIRLRNPSKKITIDTIQGTTPLLPNIKIPKFNSWEARNKSHYSIGEVRTTSEFISSRFGDEKLFFKHHK